MPLVFLVPACANSAGLVEQSLTNIFPDGVRTIEPERVSPLNFDDPRAALAFDAQHMGGVSIGCIAGSGARGFPAARASAKSSFHSSSGRDQSVQGLAVPEVADAQPRAPASPSALGRAFSQLRVAHSS